MSQEPRKTAENYSRAFRKTMGVKVPNSDKTDMIQSITKNVRCTHCGKVYQNFNQMDGFSKVRCDSCEKVFEI